MPMAVLCIYQELIPTRLSTDLNAEATTRRSAMDSLMVDEEIGFVVKTINGM